MPPTLRLPVLAVLAAASLGIALTGPALAAPAAGEPARSCVVSLPAEGEKQRGTPAKCFENLAAAVLHATDGTVHISPNSNAVTQNQLDGGKRAARAGGESRTNRVIGIEYEHRSFRGASKVYNVDTAACSNGGTYSDADLSDDPLGDEISSARSYEGCNSRHYQHSSFSGMTHDCGCASMGLMNDRTSSIRWS